MSQSDDKWWEAGTPVQQPVGDKWWEAGAPVEQAAPAPVAKASAPSGMIRRTLGDTAVDLGRGVIGLGESVVGLADLGTGGYAGKGLEAVGYKPAEAKEIIGDYYSPERKQANQTVQDTKGFLPTIGAMLENPSTIAGAVFESAPQMLGGGAAARAGASALGRVGGSLLSKPGIGRTLAAIPHTSSGRVLLAGAGEGAMQAGSSAEQSRQGSDDGLLNAKQYVAAIGSGAGTGLLTAASGGVARKLGIGDVDTLLAGGKTQAVEGAVASKVPAFVKRGLEGVVSEGVLEELPQSMQEQAWQNYADGRPLMEGVPEAGAAGLLTGAAQGGAVAAISRPQPLPAGSVLPGGTVVPDPSAGPLSRAVNDAANMGALPEQQPVAMAQPGAANAGQAGKPADDAGFRRTLDDQARAQAAASGQLDLATGELLAPIEEAPPPITTRWRDETGTQARKPEPEEVQAFMRETMDAMGDGTASVNKTKLFAAMREGEALSGRQLNEAFSVVWPQVQAEVEASTAVPNTAKASVDPQTALEQKFAGISNTPFLQIGDIGLGGELISNMVPASDWQGLKNAGVVQTAQAEDGTPYEYVPPAAIWDERERRSKAMRAAAKQASSSESSGSAQSPQATTADATSSVASQPAPVSEQPEPSVLPEKPSGNTAEPAASAAASPAVERQPESGLDQGQAAPVAASVPSAQDTPAASAVQAAAAEAATSPSNDITAPTPAQLEAGNFKVGRTKINGLDISIEHPAGVKRKAEHSQALAHAYGYVRRTEGADGEKVDVFLGDRAHDTNLPVFVVDQHKADGSFDEHKVIMGATNEAEASAMYAANFPKGWDGNQGVRQYTHDEFKAWVKDSKATKQPVTDSAAEAIAPEIRPQGKKAERGFGFAKNVVAAITERGLDPKDYEVTKTKQGGFIGVRKEAGKASPATKPGNPVQEAFAAAVTTEQLTKDQLDQVGAVLDRAEVARGEAKTDTGAERRTDLEKSAEAITLPGKQARGRPLADVRVAKDKDGKWYVAQSYGTSAGTGFGASFDDSGSGHDTREAALAVGLDALADQLPTKNFAKGEQAQVEQIRAWIAEHRPAGPAKPPTKAERKAAQVEQAERDRAVYRELLADADMVGKSEDDLTTVIKERLEIDGKALTEMAKELHREIQHKSVEREKEKHRDPAVLRAAIVDSATAAGHTEGAAFASFNAGFGHAMTGKTKSTLSGDGIDQMMAGYNAAKKWLRTEEGKAHYEGRPAKKLENTGADLRRWFEELKSEADAAKSDGSKLWAAIKKQTVRASLFPITPAKDATPGVTRLLEYARDEMAVIADYINKRWSAARGDVVMSKDGYQPFFTTRRSKRNGTIDERMSSFLDNMLSDKYRYKRDQDAPKDQWVPNGSRDTARSLAPMVPMTESEQRDVLLDMVRDYVDGVRAWHTALSKATTAKSGVDIAAKLMESNPEQYEVLFRGAVGGKSRSYSPMVPVDSKADWFANRDKSHRLEAIVRGDNLPALEKGERTKPLTAPRLDRVTRERMTDQRKGNDVTPQEFKETFGFADVGFGTWVGAKQDQDHLNYSFDAFLDLANHFGIEPKMIGLGGKLHFTIGALGHGGKAAAHFQRAQPHPDGGSVPVINVTNTKGDGTVYHEWTHAFDLAGAGGDWQQVRAKMLDMLKIQAPTESEIDAVARRFLLGQSSWTNSGKMTRADAARQALEPRYFKKFSANSTGFYANAIKLDGGKKAESDRYWSNNEELLARSAEAWASDTLGGVNTYLVNPAWVGDGRASEDSGHRGTPYPRGAERALVAKLWSAVAKATTVENGALRVNKLVFDDEVQDLIGEGEARRLFLLKPENMAAFEREILNVQQEEQTKARREKEAKEQAKREEDDRLAAQALAELDASPAAGDAMGDLSDADLEAIFDEAAAEIRESTHEDPAAPAPGEVMLDAIENATPKADFAAKQDKTAAALAKEAAKLGVTGVDEAMKGLVKLFGGRPGQLNSFPSGFDEDTYNAAKPHFKAALNAFQNAGKTLKDLFKFLIQQFGDGVKQYAIQFAKDEGLSSQLGSQPSGSAIVAKWVKEQIATKQTIDWRGLFAVADAAFGGTQGEGKYTPKDAYDALEAGLNQYIMANPTVFTPQADASKAIQAIGGLEFLLARLPTQTKRTAETDAYQQFSTVPPLAFAANWVANVSAADTMLEPSAGIGGLAVFAQNAGAKLILNELSSRRAAVLQEVFPAAKVFRENAEQIDNILPPEIVPSVVVMNPPFSASATRGASKDTSIGAQHVEQALDRLADGGRLVAIVGDGMRWDASAFKTWWAKISKEHSVRAVVPMSGKGYAKYGTTFDNVLLVIDKTKPPVGAQPITTAVESYNALIGLLSEIRNDRPTANVPAADRGSLERDAAIAERDEAAQAERNGNKPEVAGNPQPDGVGNDEPVLGSDSSGGRTGTGRAGGASRSGSRVRKPDVAGNGDGDNAGGRSGVSDSESGGRDRRSEPAAGSEVNLEASDSAHAGELTDAIFEGYTPQRLKVEGAQPHPGALVQSSAMASVVPPAPTYTPNLPKATIEKGLLSIAQIEAVVYAGQAHQQLLDDGSRRGFFIGDGTGVGKGREISGILLDNLRQGRDKAIWISEKPDLLKDAKRDFKGVGGDEKLITSQSKTPATAAIAGKGIMFSTYATLRSSAKGTGSKAGKTRLDQLVEWFGPDFDGVIAFDEAHNAGNAVAVKGKRGNTKPSSQALAVVDLQKRLPKARIVYVSATGATEVANLSFATRLGLWGEGTPFPDVAKFINQIAAGGLANMELVARDMKQMGMYLARSLSFEGVTYSRLEHELSPIQREIYDRLAEAWQVVLQNMEAALILTGAKDEESGKAANVQAVSNARSAFWGTQQRFFNQVITAMQMPAVLEQMEQDVASGKALVLQLVNTNEAAQERALAKKKGDNEEVDLEELDLTPRDALMQMVEKSFPVVQMEEQTDIEGKTIMVPVLDAEGKPVLNRKAVAMRDKLLKDLQDIKVPDGPLEMVLNHFGTDIVAEVTGRSRRVVRTPDADGNVRSVIEKRGGASARADADAFMADKKKILIFSDAGGTGFSFHADRTQKNQRKRAHYLIQPGWRANKAVQGFGRTHRTNQASAPHYYLASTNIPAHKRFLSSIARKLDQLGALTKGSRDSANQGMFSEKDNLESIYADQAIKRLMTEGLNGQVAGFMDMLEQMGLSDIVDLASGQIAETKIPPVSKFLNRMLSLKLETQETVFDAFATRMEQQVEMAIERGEFDAGLQTLKALETEVVQDEVIYTDQRTKAETRFVELKLTVPNNFHDFPNSARWESPEWMVNDRSDKVYLRVRSGDETLANGSIVPRYQLRGTNGNQSKKHGELFSRTNDLVGYKVIEPTEAKERWAKENAVRPPTVNRTTYLIDGAVLPIWDRLDTGGDKIDVVRTQTADGRRLLGRQILPSRVKEIRKRFDLSSAAAKLSPVEAIKAILQGKDAELANGWKLERARVSGEMRIELKPGYLHGPAAAELERMGMISEKIDWKQRYFVPNGTQGVPVLEKLFVNRPLVDLIDPNEVRQSRSETGTGGLSMDQGQRLKRELTAKWGDDAPRVILVASAKELQQAAGLPASVLKDPEFYRAEGVYKGNPVVWINVAAIPTAERFAKVLAHEAIGHYGVERVVGKGEWKAIATAIDRHVQSGTGTKDIRDAIAQLQRTQPEIFGDTDAVAREVIAVMAENGSRNGLVTRMVAAIGRFLRRVMPSRRWSDAEIRDLINQADSFMHAGRTTEQRQATARAYAFSRQAGPFYSALNESVASAKGAPKKGNAEQWKQWMDGAQRRGEFKQAERDWLGVDAWLKQKGMATREDLAAFVAGQQVQVQDVTLGGDGAVDMALPEGWEVQENFGQLETDLAYAVIDDAGEEVGVGATRADAITNAQDGDERSDAISGGATKFASYQLPGGENYRELLLTLPQEANRRQWGVYDGDRLISEHASRSEAKTMADNLGLEYDRIPGRDEEEPYQSSHFGQPNILAHVRYNERTDADGKRVLFIEEIQSDWHQDGRKNGYGLQPTGETATGPMAPGAPQGPRPVFRQGVPDAPFKATDEWAMLAFKRMVRHAAENGFDRIAWTTGEQQAERYDLSKHVSSVSWQPTQGGRGTLIATHKDENRDPVLEQEMASSDIADHVGKDVAEKLLASPDRGGYHELNGLDLKVGGAGMAGFYDNILPKAVNKWAKKFDGKVGQAVIAKDFRFVYDAETRNMMRARDKGADEPTVHSLDLTPQMRDAALAGLPLFSRKADSIAPQSGTGVQFAHGQETLTSRLAQWAAALHLRGSSPRAVEANAESIGAVNRGADHRNGAAEQGDESRATLREQSARLIERAKTEGFFWRADSPILAAIVGQPHPGGAEHQVFVVGEGDSRIVIRATDNGYFGQRADISPAQYLARLDDYSRTFPALQTRLIGVSESPDVEGHAVIWTAQTFVYGKKFGSQSTLSEAFAAHGWDEDGYPGVPRFKHRESGTIIEDAHTDNVFQDDNGDLYPFDVVVEALPAGTGSVAALFSKAPAAAIGDIEQQIRQVGAEVEGDRSIVGRARAALAEAVPKKLKDATRGTWLGALTLRHLVELGSDYFPTMKVYGDFMKRMEADRNMLQQEGEDSAEGVRKWAGKNIAEAGRMFELAHDATVMGVDPAEDYKPQQFKYGSKWYEVNKKNIKEGLAAIREQMRGRSGDRKQDLLAEAKGLRAMLAAEPRRKSSYPGLVARWNGLSTEAKENYVEMRDMYVRRSEMIEEALVQRIRDLKMEGGESKKRALVQMIRQQFEAQRVSGVYFPLQRFGKYFVAAEKNDVPTFMMYEDLSRLEKAVKSLRGRGFKITAQGLKSEGKAQDAPSGTFVAEVIQTMQKAGVATETQDQVYQMYLQALPEMSIRKHMIHRRSVIGFDPDAIRAYAYNLQHGSHQIARLRHAHKLQDTITVLKDQQNAARREEDSDTRKIAAGDSVLNELDRRHEWIGNPTDSKASNLVSSFGFSYYLGVTPAAALVNLSQTGLISFPYLAARFGGVKSMNALLSAMSDAARTVGHIDKTLTDADEIRAHKALQEIGALDKTQAHNLAGIAESGLAGYSPKWAQAMKVIGWGFHKTEVINREATGIATFRLAKASGMTFQQAVDAAADAIHDTHYDYSNANRARYMQSGTAKVLLMFRQYSLNTTWHLGRMVWNATKGADPEVKRIARRNLVGVLGMTGLFAGTLGLPLMSVTMGVLNAIAASAGDDDEPWDAETEFRAFLVDMFGAGPASVILGGVANPITGADIASRVSMSQLWFRSADRDLDGRGAYYNLLEQAAGPMGGVLKNALVGKQLMDDGHLMRGVETVLPKALKDSVKAARYASEGVNNLRGDPIVADLSLKDTLLQLSGFTPAEVADRYDRNRALKNYEQAVLSRRGYLMDAMAMAVRTNDSAGRRDAMASIRAFNRKYPEIVITAKSMRQSMNSRARYSRQAESGIVLNKKLAARVRASVGGAETD